MIGRPRLRPVVDSPWRPHESVEGRYGNVVSDHGHAYWHLALDRDTDHAVIYVGILDAQGACWFGTARGAGCTEGERVTIGGVVVTSSGDRVHIEGELDWAAVGPDRVPRIGTSRGTIDGDWRARTTVEVIGGIRPTKTEAACTARLDVTIDDAARSLAGPGFTDHGWGRIDFTALGAWDWVFLTSPDGGPAISATTRRTAAGERTEYGWLDGDAGLEEIIGMELVGDRLAITTTAGTQRWHVQDVDLFALRGGSAGRRGPLEERFCRFSGDRAAAVGVVETLRLTSNEAEQERT